MDIRHITAITRCLPMASSPQPSGTERPVMDVPNQPNGRRSWRAERFCVNAVTVERPRSVISWQTGPHFGTTVPSALGSRGRRVAGL